MIPLDSLNICFMAGTLGQGGAERQLYYILNTLCQCRSRVRLLSMTRGEFWERKILDLGIPVIWVGEETSRRKRLYRIVEELRREVPDVVQSQHFHTNLYVAMAARLLGLKGIGSSRNDPHREVEATGKLLGKLSLMLPKVVVANSRASLQHMSGSRWHSQRRYYLTNVIDTDHFRPAPTLRENAVQLLTIGRLVTQKRHDRFVSLIASLKKTLGKDIKGVIIGSGPLEYELKEQAEALEVPTSLLAFKGSVEDPRQIYQRSDILVLTSDWEGTPNVVLEAMACGLSVVATRVGGLPDIICHGETGFLVEPDDRAGLQKTVLDLIHDPLLRETIGQRARKYIIEHHALSKLSDSLARLYTDVLSAGSHA